jgi:hypothetical protein
MTHHMRLVLAVVMLTFLICNPLVAQIFAPNVVPPNPPPPPPPPPPKIEVPVVPKLDAPPPQPTVKRSRRGSFSDRVTNCLHQGAAAGLNPSDRAAYSRACANQ